MPQRGQKRPLVDLGWLEVNQKGQGRIGLSKMPELGVKRKTTGPWRPERVAEEDLEKARRCESRQEMLEFVRALWLSDAHTPPARWKRRAVECLDVSLGKRPRALDGYDVTDGVPNKKRASLN